MYRKGGGGEPATHLLPFKRDTVSKRFSLSFPLFSLKSTAIKRVSSGLGVAEEFQPCLLSPLCTVYRYVQNRRLIAGMVWLVVVVE